MTRSSDDAPSDYVDWVDHVMREVASAIREGSGTTQLVGASLDEITRRMGVNSQSRDLVSVDRALRELTDVGLLVTDDHRRYRLSGDGRKFPDSSLSTVVWPTVFGEHLVPAQEEFLLLMWQVSAAEPPSNHPVLPEIVGEDVYRRAGWAWDAHEAGTRCAAMLRTLEDVGMVQRRHTTGPPAARLTYAGAVRASRQWEHRWQAQMRELVAEWENSNVNFKRQLNLSRDAEKAEFVRDALGLINTKSPGERHLIIGFDDQTHAFHTSVDETITQERLEQVLQAWARPAPPLRWEVVPWEGGFVGVATFERVARLIPHVAVKSGGKLRAGVVYARHGSHTDPATEVEADELHAEGEAARAADSEG